MNSRTIKLKYRAFFTPFQVNYRFVHEFVNSRIIRKNNSHRTKCIQKIADLKYTLEKLASFIMPIFELSHEKTEFLSM